MPPVRLYQIAYSAASLAAVEPGYELLDNLDNARPDWFEYWPIRRFLQQQALDEAAYYGFFSPKFGAKTQLSHSDVVAFVQALAASTDVLLFSPQPDMAAFFLNVFEQAETFDAGLIDAFETLLAGVGRPTGLRSLVMDSRNTVFSNYFVARPAFWRKWLALNEALFAVCEGADSPLRQALTRTTSYQGAQRKVFLQERVASYLLSTQPQWRCRAVNPFGFGGSMSRLRDFPAEAVLSDALKIALRDTGWDDYRKAFGAIRARCFQAAPAA